MSIFVTAGGVALGTGNTAADLAAMTYTELNALTVAEMCALRNTHILLDPTPEINFQLEERSTASFEVWDREDHHTFEYGQEVVIRGTDDTDILFGGVIDSIQKTPISPDGGAGYCYSLSCIDYQALADRRQFFHAYESAAADTIVRDILAVLAEEGVTEGEIQAGPVLERIGFNGVSCAEAMQTACERSGFTWFISEEKKLYFIERATYPAAWDIVDGSEILFNPPPAITYGNPEYRNVQYLQSSYAETSSLTQNFKGDGKNQTFTVGFPIAKEPTVTLNSLPQTVGIKGVDISGYDWYWNEGENTVVQDTTGTVLTASDDLEITYIGYYKLITKVTESAEVTRQRLAQGFGTGKIEKTYKDITLKSQDTALEAAKAKLAHYATVGIQLEYDTLAGGLAVGTMQSVTLPILGLAATDMLIYSMKISWPDAVTTRTIQACQGPVNDSWQNLFCGIVQELKKQASAQAGEADVVQGLEEFSKDWLATDHPNPFIAVYPGTATPTDADFPCLEDADKLSYCVLYSGGVEFTRKPVTAQVIGTVEITTTVLFLAAEANDQVISHVGLWGGDGCTDTAGTGIEMSKYAYSKAKNSLESLQFDFVDSKDW